MTNLSPEPDEKSTDWLCLPCGYIGAPQRKTKGKSVVCPACGSSKIVHGTSPKAPQIVNVKGGGEFARFRFMLKVLIVV